MLDGPYQHCRPLTDDEYASLKADIEQHGVIEYVHVDENGAILVGHHRARAAAELGIEYPRHVVVGLSEQEKHEYAVRLESLGRSKDIETKKYTVLDLWRDPNVKIKQKRIAELVGVWPQTVSGWVKQAEEEEKKLRQETNSSDEFVSAGPERVADTQGRMQPTSYAPRQPKAVAEREAVVLQAIESASPLLEEPEAERALYALSRAKFWVYLEPAAVAEAAADPTQDAPGYLELAAWIAAVAEAIQTRARGLRVVGG